MALVSEQTQPGDGRTAAGASAAGGGQRGHSSLGPELWEAATGPIRSSSLLLAP